MRISKKTSIDFSNLNYLSESAYNSSKWNLGKGLIANNWATAIDKYIAPDFQAIRPMEESTAFAIVQISAYNLSSTIAYIFGVENSTGATATRRVALWELNRKTGARSWKWFITMTLATATAHTVRDFKIDVKTESTWTVQTTGTALTGTWTAFATNKVAIGARIWFGSTDPSQITNWYRISARASDTGLTLGTSPWNIPALTPYVIQEFRPVYAATNATTTNGGIHYGKGISIEDFTPAGTTIPLAVSTDDQKAMYWLKDASTQTNIVSAWCAIDFTSATPTNLTTYVLDLPVAGSYKVYKYNIRAALTVATGASVSAWQLTTANQVFTGTGSQNANLCIANASHWLGSGVLSLYFVTTTRIYRTAVANITSGNATWISNVIAEVPPWGTQTFALTSVMNTIEYMPSIDSFIVGTTHAGWVFSYVTQYVASGAQFQKMFGRDYKYLEQSLKDSNIPTHFSNRSIAYAYTDAGANRIFAVSAGTAISTNHIYVMAFGADWDYASQSSGRLITPKITLPNATKFYEAFANNIRYIGNTILGKPTEPFRVLARTANIDTDATTGWATIDETNDISWLSGTDIQFAIEFRTIGEVCMPSRILAVNVSYEDNAGLDNYVWSEAKSSSASKIFAFYFKTAFGSTVPTLRINLIDTDTGWLILTDTTTASANGVWEKTTDWTTWTTYNTTDRANSTTYIRYTPTSIADNIKVTPIITLA